MGVIELKSLTKDYGEGRGIFDFNLSIEKGEMIGFVGTNGSGKTTTIRSIMGFIRPTSGCACVNGLTSWEHSSEVVKDIGYVPGEIAFPDLATGTQFLKSQAEFLGLKDLSYANEIIKRLQLDPRANLKRMSKGMKQKTAIVSALMNDSEIIILDEPTTGLDPLMRLAFMDIITKEHERGKTILMSNHMFNEVESSCDRVVLIDKGHIIDVADMHYLLSRPEKDYKIEFVKKQDYEKFKKTGYKIIRDQSIYNQVTVNVKNQDVNKLFSDLKDCQVKFITEVKFSLEKYFKAKLIEKKEGAKNV